MSNAKREVVVVPEDWVQTAFWMRLPKTSYNDTVFETSFLAQMFGCSRWFEARSSCAHRMVCAQMLGARAGLVLQVPAVSSLANSLLRTWMAVLMKRCPLAVTR